MKLKCAADFLAVVKNRGMSLRIDQGPPKMVVLVIPKGLRKDATDVLLDALRAWRLEIIAELEKLDAEGRTESREANPPH